MTEYESVDKVEGLAQLRREVAPPHDLWPGIQARLRPRRRAAGLPAWGGFALAASLLLAVALPLRQIGLPHASPAGSRVPDPDRQVRYYSGQLQVVSGAETELLRALELNPQSPSLQRLLETTRQRQRELRRMANHIV